MAFNEGSEVLSLITKNLENTKITEVAKAASNQTNLAYKTDSADWS